MTSPSMIPRVMTLADLEMVIGWAADEGWNPGIDDAAAYFAADDQGFFLAEVEGQPVAAISVVNHTAELSFLGLYLCRPEFRGQGIGYALWTHALQHAGTRTVGLDAVEAQRANYEASGFVSHSETQRFRGQVERKTATDVRPVRSGDLNAMTELEAKASGYAKAALMAAWTDDTATRKTLVLDGEEGFVTIRACGTGHKIGPLVATTHKDALTLLHAAADIAKGPFEIDVPDDAKDLMRYCQHHDMEVAMTTTRMYRGPAMQPGPLPRAIATLELG